MSTISAVFCYKVKHGLFHLSKTIPRIEIKDGRSLVKLTAIGKGPSYMAVLLFLYLFLKSGLYPHTDEISLQHCILFPRYSCNWSWDFIYDDSQEHRYAVKDALGNYKNPHYRKSVSFHFLNNETAHSFTLSEKAKQSFCKEQHLSLEKIWCFCRMQFEICGRNAGERIEINQISLETHTKN